MKKRVFCLLMAVLLLGTAAYAAGLRPAGVLYCSAKQGSIPKRGAETEKSFILLPRKIKKAPSEAVYIYLLLWYSEKNRKKQRTWKRKA